MARKRVSMAKLRRPFELTTTAQAAALASLDDPAEIERRRLFNGLGLRELTRVLREHDLEPLPDPVANFVCVDLGEDAAPLFERLLMEGVIVRPLAGFGMPTGLRISVGTDEEIEFLGAALGRVRQSGG